MVLLLLAKTRWRRLVARMLLCRSDLNTIEKGYCFLPRRGLSLYTWGSSSYLCSAHTRLFHSQIWSAARLVSHETADGWAAVIVFTLSTRTNPLTTLNKVIACLGCWRVFLLCSLFIWISLTYIVERFMSNAEYAMLLVYALMIKWVSFFFRSFFLKWCTPKFLVFCLLFAVSCVLIIPVLHHDLIWLLAFLRNRFWRKDN